MESDRGYGGIGISRQDEADRRQVRRRYNDLNQKVKNRTSGQVDLTDAIKEADELLDEIEKKEMTAREAVLDANVFKQISTRCREQAQGMSANEVEFIGLEYAAKLKNKMGGNSDEDGSLIQKHWIDFGKQIQWTFKRGPPLKYFYGAFESDVNREAKLSPKKKSISHNKAISRPKPSIATKVTTSTKKNSDKNETETTEQFVEQIFNIIEKEYRNNKKQPICYYGLVTNPNSFSATVKSMFYLSFLVKDRRVTLWFDENDTPYVWPTRAHENNRRADAKGSKNNLNNQVGQVIMSIDKKRWRKIIDAFEIKEAKIKRDGEDEDIFAP
jgi:hypothetical protein